ncbi:MAG: acetyltransferase [Flavobacteriales bacterium]
MSRSLNILGFTPSILNILLELAEESNGYNTFNIIKNMEVNNSEFFKPLSSWDISYFDSKEEEITEDVKNKSYALSVVGTNSKELVFNHFKSILNYNKNQFINLIHPTSYVARSVHLNYGLTLENLSTIASCTTLGFGITVKRNCNIGHHNIIEDYVTLNPSVTTCGYVKIGKYTMIGAGAIIKDDVEIGQNTIIGMGSVVLKDIPSNCIAFGNPCKVVKLLNSDSQSSEL